MARVGEADAAVDGLERKALKLEGTAVHGNHIPLRHLRLLRQESHLRRSRVVYPVKDSWEHEGLGSGGRGRGRSRRSRGVDVRTGGDNISWEPSSTSSGVPYPAPLSGTTSDRITDYFPASSEKDAWKHEGFGSCGRGRASSRRSQGRAIHAGGYSSDPQSPSLSSTFTPGVSYSSFSGGTSSDPSPDAFSASSEKDAWKHEGFGSGGRGRDSGQRSEGIDVHAGEQSNSCEPQSSSPSSTSSPGVASSDRSTDAASASRKADAWKHEGFGLTGRGRSSSRRSRAREVHAAKHSCSGDPKPFSPTSTSSCGAFSDRTADAACASSKEDAWKHEGFGSSGRGQGTFLYRSRHFANKMLFRYLQNPDLK